jgi:hypothetical protein
MQRLSFNTARHPMHQPTTLAPPSPLPASYPTTPGFCFVHYQDKRDAEDAIHALDGWEALPCTGLACAACMPCFLGCPAVAAVWLLR